MSEGLSELVIAFDCDGTLDISEADPGPIPAPVMMYLQQQGAIVGICGNTDPIYKHGYMPFMDFPTMNQDKAHSLRAVVEMYEGKTLYIFVGNTEGDRQAAREAGWTFIHADDFKMKVE